MLEASVLPWLDRWVGLLVKIHLEGDIIRCDGYTRPYDFEIDK